MQGCVVRPAKIPHHFSLQLKSLIFYYIRRPSACHLYPETIPSSHHLTHWELVNNYSSTYSQLGILSYIFLSFLSQKYIYKSTSLTFNYMRKTNRITHQVLGSIAPGYNFLKSGLNQLGYLAIYSTQHFLIFITQPKGPKFNSYPKHIFTLPFHPPFSPQFIFIHLYILHPHSPLLNNNVLDSIPTLSKHHNGHHLRIKPSP